LVNLSTQEVNNASYKAGYYKLNKMSIWNHKHVLFEFQVQYHFY